MPSIIWISFIRNITIYIVLNIKKYSWSCFSKQIKKDLLGGKKVDPPFSRRYVLWTAYSELIFQSTNIILVI